MNSQDDVKITLTSDNGIKNQWGRGLLYRGDGRKKTIVSTKLLWFVVGGFIVIVIVLLCQSPPEQEAEKPKRESSFLPPMNGSQPVMTIDVPSVHEGTMAPSEQSGRSHGGQAGAKTTLKFRGPQLVTRPRAGKIPPGSMVKAILLSGASNGPVRAQIVESLSVSGERVVEEGTMLVGIGQSGEDRLTIRFNQMVFKDGGFESVEAQACDTDDKIPGLKGSKVGSHALKFATGVGLGFLGGMTEALQDSRGQGGAVVRPPSLKNALLNGVATTALDQSREMLTDARNKPPVIEVPSGTPLFILFQKD